MSETAQQPSAPPTGETPAPTASEPTPAVISSEEPKTPPAAAPIPIAWDKLTFPEGVVADAADPLNKEFLDLLSNSEMSAQDRAQALINLQHKASTSAAERRSADFDKLQKDWADEIKNDPAVGGAKFDANQQTVRRLVTQYGSPELNRILAETGAGNRIELFNFLLKLAPFALEPEPSNRGQPSSAVDNSEEAKLARAYPSMKS